MLVGGYAVGYHGYPRATLDLDVWVANDADNAVKVSDALARFGFDVNGLSPELFQQANKVVRMGIPPVRIDVLTTVSGLKFESSYARRDQADVDGVSVHIIGLDDLKRNKRAAGRHNDLNDLEHLP